MNLCFLLGFLLVLLGRLGVSDALAANLLPYTQRTHSYSGWSSSTRGDIRTIGMGGATVGLADTFLAAVDNPAGLAMTLDTGDLNFTTNEIRDGYIQDESLPMSLRSYGTAINSYPWGLSLGYTSTYREGQENINIQISEYRFSAARLFDDNRFSLGIVLIFGVSDQTITDVSSHSVSLGTSLGAMYQLPRRLLIGISYRPSMRYAPTSPSTTEPAQLPGFFQPIDVPGKFELGLGWVPNRFVRANVSLGFIGTSENAALLRDDTIRTGTSVTVQPRFGANYVFVDFRQIRMSAFAGSYFENTRIDSAYNRLHFTGGFEAKLWFVTAGVGTDLSAHYQNNLVSIGLDPFKLLEMAGLIPRPWQPPQGGLFPSPLHLSDAGLPRPLVKNWKQHGPDMNPIKVGLDIPTKIGEKIDLLTQPKKAK